MRRDLIGRTDIISESGVIGGFFLALSYFGTDQSQVGRYLTAKSHLREQAWIVDERIRKSADAISDPACWALWYLHFINSIPRHYFSTSRK